MTTKKTYKDMTPNFVVMPIAEREQLKAIILERYGAVSAFIKNNKQTATTTFAKVLNGDARICPKKLQKIKTMVGMQ
jgi:hypothetical protein